MATAILYPSVMSTIPYTDEDVSTTTNIIKGLVA
ncbi:MAG: hypothetical protein HW421_1086 [Ignavibacteria bacterium]|nr:hypothetical protein [Ignavibacteria bacterium]